MSQVDYTAMSYQELRWYFLKHREDKAAFQAYLARRRERSAESRSADRTLPTNKRDRTCCSPHQIYTIQLER